MRKITLLAAFVSLLLVGCTNPQTEDTTMKEQTVIENILSRKSVRYFTGDTISQAQIETLLRCAMAAPSAMNKQPWAFIVVTDPALLQRIGSEMPNTRCLNRPACAFVPCGDLSKAIESRPDFWVNDVSAATENLLLAAHAMGLGAVWTGIHPDPDRVAQLQAILQLPEHIVPLCVVPVGLPAESPAVKEKFNEDNIRYNRW
ncbi:MAG: nitroreductase family protein [Paludibacteraceae bacterium]